MRLPLLAHLLVGLRARHELHAQPVGDARHTGVFVVVGRSHHVHDFRRERIGGSRCRRLPQRLCGAPRREAVRDKRHLLRLLRREAEHTRRIAHGAAPTPRDVLAHHRRVFATVALVDVLQHALAVAVREINIDVGRLGALLAQEPFEQQLELDGIHRRDAEAVADGAVGGRTAPLAEDPVAVREAHDVPDDQEVAGEPELGDEREFMLQLLVVPRRASPSPPLLGAALDEPREIFVLAHARRQGEVRQARLEVGQPERAPLGDDERLPDAHVVVLPAAAHLRVPLEVPLAVGTQARPHGLERLPVAQRAEHVVREPLRGARVVHVVGHHPRHVEGARHGDEFARECALLGNGVIPHFHGDAPPEDVEQGGERLARRIASAAQQRLRHCTACAAGERIQSIGVPCECVERNAR